MAKWMVSARKADFRKIAQECGISIILARLIRNRGVIGAEATDRYLHAALSDLHAPNLLPDADRTVNMLSEAIESRKHIRIIGDYDVDGICSTYIFLHVLGSCGADADAVLPDRIIDGYGLNERMVRDAIKEDVQVILTCDNGIAAADALSLAGDSGIVTLVTDHHEVPFTLEENGTRTYHLPPAQAVCDPKCINPDTGKTDYPFPEICGAVVAFKISDLLLQKLCPERRKDILDELLPFCALATVCDVMPLQDENRILVREGLARAKETDNEGLRALIDVTGLSGKEITCYHAGFVLGPCLNATGRLDSATRALELFCQTDRSKALRMAQELKDLNESRKSMTAQGVEMARRQMQERHTDDRVLVLYLPQCHESLAGIIAGRIREQYSRPTFVLTRTENGTVKGSGRSVDAYDMYEGMSRCSDLFIQFGGHKMAGGLSLEEKNVDAFRKRVNENCRLTREELCDTIHIDMELPPRYIDIAATEEMQLLEPCGNGNPRPLFVTRDITLRRIRVLGKQQNVLRVTAEDAEGCVLDLIRFEDAEIFRGKICADGQSSAWDDLLRGAGNVTINMVYYPDINEWRGRKSLQFVVQAYVVKQESAKK